MLKTMQYYWNAARGYRFKPWKSPYIRWRFETFLGKEATNLTASKFIHLAWKYRDHMERFVDWPRKDSASSAVATPESRTHPFNRFD